MKTTSHQDQALVDIFTFNAITTSPRLCISCSASISLSSSSFQLAFNQSCRISQWLIEHRWSISFSSQLPIRFVLILFSHLRVPRKYYRSRSSTVSAILDLHRNAQPSVVVVINLPSNFLATNVWSRHPRPFHRHFFVNFVTPNAFFQTSSSTTPVFELSHQDLQ